MKAKLIIEGKEIEIEILEEECKKLQLLEEKKTGYERVTEGDKFYYESGRGIVEPSFDRYDNIDDDYYRTASYCSSKTVAENNARADKLMRQLRRFAVEHRKHGVNLNDTNTGKYYVWYNYGSAELGVSLVFYSKILGAIYFDSEETANAAIDEFHDELVWYFTEYKDSL